MGLKTWLWRKKPSVKTIIANGKAVVSLVGINHKKAKTQEVLRSLEELNEQLLSARAESVVKDDLLAKQATGLEKAKAEAAAFRRELDDVLLQKEELNEELLSARVESIVKDDLLAKHATGLEKAEAEAAAFRRELDDALLQKAAAEERLINSETSLKESMQQLRIVKAEHQDMMNDIITKLSSDQARARALEEMLTETKKKVVELEVENTNLSKILEAKEKLIEDLSVYKFQSEENFTMMQLDASEKSISTLKYEVCMLQKELDIRIEERDLNLRVADAARNQQLQSNKKITKLETECQKLCVMVRKRLPGPARNQQLQSSPTPYDLSLAPISEDPCDEESSCAKFWASALISELERLSNGKQPSQSSRTSGTSELSLMDDFVEMERLKSTTTKNESLDSAQEI